jgi:hypothetical protein
MRLGIYNRPSPLDYTRSHVGDFHAMLPDYGNLSKYVPYRNISQEIVMDV